MANVGWLKIEQMRKFHHFKDGLSFCGKWEIRKTEKINHYLPMGNECCLRCKTRFGKIMLEEARLSRLDQGVTICHQHVGQPKQVR